MKFLYITIITLFLNILMLEAQVSFLENGETIWLHHLERGEQLTDLAILYGVSVQEIKTANNMSQNGIGWKYIAENSSTFLKIPMPLTKDIAAIQNYGGRFLIHKVLATDALHLLAEKYQTSVAEIVAINRLQSNHLKNDTYILVPNNLPEMPAYTTKLRMSGFASAGFFMGNTYSWEGNTTYSYTVNGRYNLKHEYNRSHYRFTTQFFSSLGFRHDIGKYFFKNVDRFELRNKLEYREFGKVTPFIMTSIHTQLFKSNFIDFEGTRHLTGTIMAPGYTHFSLGTMFQGSIYALHFGLYEIKTTHVLNKELFGDKPSIYGVQAGKTAYIEHGLSLRANISYYNGEKIKIQSDIYTFLNANSIDFELRSDISYQINKYFKVSMMTEILFDKEYSDKMQFRNEIVTAFMFYK